MIRWTIPILCMALAAGSLAASYWVVSGSGRGPAIHHRSTAPTLQRVRELADLVVLNVPITDVHFSEMEGRTGGLRVAVAVHGDVQVATDLSTARFDSLEPEKKQAVLILPRPAPQRPRLDHERTKILEMQRTGLWRLFKQGSAGEDLLTNQALRSAQRVLARAAEDPELVARACGHTIRVMEGFFEALGWEVFVLWEDEVATTARVD